MKKVTSLFFGLITIFLFSCSKEGSESQVENLRVAAVKNLKNQEERKASYLLLTPGEKALTWRGHLKNAVEQNNY